MPLQIIRQDITAMEVDAIVNTSNEEMVGYSGVDRLVHEKAGPELDAFCRSLRPLELGFAKATPGFRLNCRYIIHTSGPVWHGGRRGEHAILKSCYLESLRLARERGCRSVAFPLISSGNYGYPKDQVLKHAVQVISEFLQDNEMDVYLCVWDRESYEFSRQLHADISRFIDSRLPGAGTRVEAAPLMASKAPRFPIPRREKQAKKEDPEKCADAVPEPPGIGEDHGATTMPYGGFEPTSPCVAESLEAHLKAMDAGFADTLFRYIDEREMTDVECYKKANVDKKTFSKIKCNQNYRPSKQTAIAFAIALKLDLNETEKLLRTAGLALSHSNKFDLIIEYFISRGIYDIYEINQALFEFDQVLLGC